MVYKVNDLQKGTYIEKVYKVNNLSQRYIYRDSSQSERSAVETLHIKDSLQSERPL